MPGSKAHQTFVMKSIELIISKIKDNDVVHAVFEVISTLLNGYMVDHSLPIFILTAFWEQIETGTVAKPKPGRSTTTIGYISEDVTI